MGVIFNPDLVQRLKSCVPLHRRVANRLAFARPVRTARVVRHPLTLPCLHFRREPNRVADRFTRCRAAIFGSGDAPESVRLRPAKGSEFKARRRGHTLPSRGGEGKREAPVAVSRRMVAPPPAPKPSLARQLEIKHVTVQTSAPRDGHPGIVEVGYYSVSDGVVQMHDDQGRPIAG